MTNSCYCPRSEGNEDASEGSTVNESNSDNVLPWDVGNVHMKGGAGQMNPVLSWGTLKRSGIVSSVGTVRI